MSRKLHRCVVIFGGFRTATLEGSRTVVTLLKALKVDRVSHENLWRQQGDSLEKRYHRAANWFTSQTNRSLELHILGHSMGCQLAVKFAHLAHISAPANWRLGQLILSAPDPKYHRSPWDLIEKQASEMPAYDEASKLWRVEGAAGPRFTDTLGLVAGAFRRGCRVVFCKGDTVAEWHQNVEIMRSSLNSCSAIKWIEAIPDAVVDSHGIRVALNPDEIVHIKDANQFHEVLWYCSEISSQPCGKMTADS